MSAKGTGRCNCEATLVIFVQLCQLGEVLKVEESKCHSHPQEGPEGGPRELQASQPYLHPREGDGT